MLNLSHAAFLGSSTSAGQRSPVVIPTNELLDETLDYGYPQGTSTEMLRNHVRNEPILVDSVKALRIPSVGTPAALGWVSRGTFVVS